MQELYPLKFSPVYKEKIWGGTKIREILNMDFSPLSNCGEAWILSGYEGQETAVTNGFLIHNELNELVEVYMDELVGDAIYKKFGNEFPLLIKIIDSKTWLSVQVHPDDELAMERHESLGKTEMWYILDADEDAELIVGFNRKLDKSQYLEALNTGKIQNILNFEKVKKGEVYYIPAGRVHALGPGNLLIEIQQSSDVTYRIYDWDRIDAAGVQRQLHTEEALNALDFNPQKEYRTPYEIKKNATSKIIESPYFITNIISLHNANLTKDYSPLDSFVILIAAEGEGSIHSINDSVEIKTGEAILIPASSTEIEIKTTSQLKLLEVFMIVGYEK
jgi:mannose-6-phosphate isomerase